MIETLTNTGTNIMTNLLTTLTTEIEIEGSNIQYTTVIKANKSVIAKVNELLGTAEFYAFETNNDTMTIGYSVDTSWLNEYETEQEAINDFAREANEFAVLLTLNTVTNDYKFTSKSNDVNYEDSYAKLYI